MLIILIQNFQNLGIKGKVLNVKKGYALNYLIPQGIATAATKPKVLKLAEEIAAQKFVALKLAEKAVELQKEFEGKKFAIKANVTKEGKLYGSISEHDIIEAIKKATKIELVPENIKMKAIKEIGEHELTLELSKEVEVNVIINVTAKE